MLTSVPEYGEREREKNNSQHPTLHLKLWINWALDDAQRKYVKRDISYVKRDLCTSEENIHQMRLDCIWIHMCVCVYCKNEILLCVYICVCVCICICICKYAHTCINTTCIGWDLIIYIHMYTCVWVCMCVYIYTYIYICIYTHTHI